VEELAKLAADVLSERQELIANLDEDREEALKTIIRVGTSAGGARAKAVIAWNAATGEVRSGQVAPPEGFEPWILKFDGVNKEALGDPEGFGRVEFAYHRMAVAAGIEMTACRLLEEGDRAHFMTRRFDRGDSGEKTHIQSLCAMAHYDYNAPGEYSYEQAFAVIQKLKLGCPTMEEMYRRMIFNVLARNQDDHTKNITFLMDREGTWKLAPAYDVIWSHRSDSPWVARHQMRVNGKLDGFTADDLLAVAEQYGIRRPGDVLDRVGDAVSRWKEFASEAGVDKGMMREIGRTHRLQISRGGDLSP
jgi:serine/threonine-protein kinase HipA